MTQRRKEEEHTNTHRGNQFAICVQDILKFGVIFMVLFVAFLVGLHNLYWYYPKTVRHTVELFENNITTNAEKYFGM